MNPSTRNLQNPGKTGALTPGLKQWIIDGVQPSLRIQDGVGYTPLYLPDVQLSRGIQQKVPIVVQFNRNGLSRHGSTGLYRNGLILGTANLDYYVSI